MLILTRKKNETIRIGHDIAVVLLEVRGDKARIGIQAPEGVKVHRQEVYDAIHGTETIPTIWGDIGGEA